MNTSFPSASEVRAALEALSYAQIVRLAGISGVPMTTLWRLRSGETENPGIETVRKFAEHIAVVAEAP
jgi:transcriptional regulator with XRE-family HTH domain